MTHQHYVLLSPIPNMQLSSTKHLIAEGITFVVWFGVLAWAISVARRNRSPLPLLMMLGGAITYGYEPVVDTLGKCWLPSTHQWTLFTVLGRHMPVYGVFVYSAFFGGFSIMAWSYLKAGRDPKGLWRLYVVAILINTFLFETPAILIHFYRYYGHQPFNFWGFPLWWPFVNTAGPIAGGALAYVLSEHTPLDRRALLAFAFISEPFFDGLSNGAAGGPTWMAMNSHVPVVVIWLVGCLTLAIAALIVGSAVWGVGLLKASAAPSAPAQAASAAQRRQPEPVAVS
jgi:hypothetical protein